MPKYDVYRLSDGRHLLDVQGDHIVVDGTRVVVPLLPAADAPNPVSRLHPILEVDGKRMSVATHLIAAVSAAALKRPIAELGQHADAITRALDTLLTDW